MLNEKCVNEIIFNNKHLEPSQQENSEYSNFQICEYKKENCWQKIKNIIKKVIKIRT